MQATKAPTEAPFFEEVECLLYEGGTIPLRNGGSGGQSPPAPQAYSIKVLLSHPGKHCTWGQFPTRIRPRGWCGGKDIVDLVSICPKGFAHSSNTQELSKTETGGGVRGGNCSVFDRDFGVLNFCHQGNKRVSCAPPRLGPRHGFEAEKKVLHHRRAFFSSQSLKK